MSEELRTGPIELSDIDFRDFVVPPAASFEDTMRQRGGWGPPSREVLERSPFVANYDPTDEHVEAMLRFAADTYAHFGGGEGKLPFAVSYEEVYDYVTNFENQDSFMVHAFEDEIAGLAHRYLNGEGEDYERFHNLLQLI